MNEAGMKTVSFDGKVCISMISIALFCPNELVVCKGVSFSHLCLSVGRSVAVCLSVGRSLSVCPPCYSFGLDRGSCLGADDGWRVR